MFRIEFFIIRNTKKRNEIIIMKEMNLKMNLLDPKIPQYGIVGLKLAARTAD